MLNPDSLRCNFGLTLTNDLDTAAIPVDTDAIILEVDAILLLLSRSLESPVCRSSLSASKNHVQALTKVTQQSVNFVINQSSLEPMTIHKQTYMYIVYFGEFTIVTNLCSSRERFVHG